MIPVKNIYYMLAYAFKCLKTNAFKHLSCEEFDHIDDLFAEIIILGLRPLIKQGLLRDYESVTESTSTPHGKMDVSATIKGNTLSKRQIVCSYDEFTENFEFNRIIKTTCQSLCQSREVSQFRKSHLRKLMQNFANVLPIDLHVVDWNKRFNRNNQIYKMLIYVCHWLYKKQIQKEKNGTKKGTSFIDEQQRSHLYEKFIYEFFKQEYAGQLQVSAIHVNWQLDLGSDRELLPDMRTDITLRSDSKMLIIDAKYYGHEMQSHYDVQTLRSGHLYQIFAYVKNKAWEQPKINVSGMLLYAKTSDDVILDQNYLMSGNKIAVKNLDLNQNFTAIRKQLDCIANQFLA